MVLVAITFVSPAHLMGPLYSSSLDHSSRSVFPVPVLFVLDDFSDNFYLRCHLPLIVVRVGDRGRSRGDRLGLVLGLGTSDNYVRSVSRRILSRHTSFLFLRSVLCSRINGTQGGKISTRSTLSFFYRSPPVAPFCLTFWSRTRETYYTQVMG